MIVMKTKIMQLIGIFVFISQVGCGQNKTEKKDKSMIKQEQYNSISKLVKLYDYNPTYQLRLSSNLCTYEVYINDLLVDFSFTSGRTAGEQIIDIPQYILKSGKQSIRYKVFPKAIKNGELESVLDADSQFSLRIVHGEYNKTPRDSFKEVLKMQLPKLGMNLPSAEFSSEFTATVPYVLNGWQDGMDLTKEDSKKVQEEVIGKFKQFQSAFIAKDVATVANMIYNREKEIAQAYFFNSESPNNYNQAWQELAAEMAESRSMEILDDYSVRYFANGKVVSILIQNGKWRNFSPLCSKNSEGGMDFYELYFYRPRSGTALEVIR